MTSLACHSSVTLKSCFCDELIDQYRKGHGRLILFRLASITFVTISHVVDQLHGKEGRPFSPSKHHKKETSTQLCDGENLCLTCLRLRFAKNGAFASLYIHSRQPNQSILMSPFRNQSVTLRLRTPYLPMTASSLKDPGDS
jgi:hypothetical protein